MVKNSVCVTVALLIEIAIHGQVSLQAVIKKGNVLNSLTFIIFAEKNDETLSPNSLSILQSG